MCRASHCIAALCLVIEEENVSQETCGSYSAVWSKLSLMSMILCDPCGIKRSVVFWLQVAAARPFLGSSWS